MDKAEELRTLLRIKELLLKLPWGSWYESEKAPEWIEATFAAEERMVEFLADPPMREFVILAHNYLWHHLACDFALRNMRAEEDALLEANLRLAEEEDGG